MKIIDAHCDVLMKMYENENIHFDHHLFLDVTKSRLLKSNTLMQCFAIYISEQINNPNIDHILQYVYIFHDKVLKHNNFIHIKNKSDLKYALTKNKTGAMLTLEGVDALGGNLTYLRILYELGVRCIGITWNYGNWAADGVLEPRGSSFSLKGKKLVEICNDLGIVLDVSHLNEKSFWDFTSFTNKPFIASHSNVFDLCNHVRNLKKNQITEIIKINGRIGLCFYPRFVNNSEDAYISDLLKHIEYVCELGGEHHLGFGSDFDGIDQCMNDLRHTGDYITLKETLLKYYPENIVEGFMYKNWFDFFEENLPNN
ncbi:dipeptidase [Chengkuizengella axinellae]|uniref:Dipeptidase n=1 Tax=Chengkuizengella axinellae TaxID=3064388 RepID=A0ABT9IVX9_9BACL|nr:dipeptidase [Chengkuizengella sp. 2205SS18-9]MDP5273519.1 dipeptidase [Chengkuizengella sp. 2205SS18-9]